MKKIVVFGLSLLCLLDAITLAQQELEDSTTEILTTDIPTTESITSTTTRPLQVDSRARILVGLENDNFSLEPFIFPSSEATVETRPTIDNNLRPNNDWTPIVWPSSRTSIPAQLGTQVLTTQFQGSRITPTESRRPLPTIVAAPARASTVGNAIPTIIPSRVQTKIQNIPSSSVVSTAVVHFELEDVGVLTNNGSNQINVSGSTTPHSVPEHDVSPSAAEVSDEIVFHAEVPVVRPTTPLPSTTVNNLDRPVTSKETLEIPSITTSTENATNVSKVTDATTMTNPTTKLTSLASNANNTMESTTEVTNFETATKRNISATVEMESSSTSKIPTTTLPIVINEPLETENNSKIEESANSNLPSSANEIVHLVADPLEGEATTEVVEEIASVKPDVMMTTHKATEVTTLSQGGLNVTSTMPVENATDIPTTTTPKHVMLILSTTAAEKPSEEPVTFPTTETTSTFLSTPTLTTASPSVSKQNSSAADYETYTSSSTIAESVNITSAATTEETGRSSTTFTFWTTTTQSPKTTQTPTTIRITTEATHIITSATPFVPFTHEQTTTGHSDFSPITEGSSSNKPDNTTTVVAVSVSIAAILCAALLILLLFLLRRRRTRAAQGTCQPARLDAYSLDNVSPSQTWQRGKLRSTLRASKRSYLNHAFEDPSAFSNPLTAAQLALFMEKPVSNIESEFQQIPTPSIVRIEELPSGVETKNRYANVLPVPETRVKIRANENTNEDTIDQYINANYVRGPKDEARYYIACQAPLESTVPDFWQMIWENQTKMIIQLTDLSENGVARCAEYLPPSEVLDCHRLYGDFQVTLKTRELRENYITSYIQLKHMEDNLVRDITHLWYSAWPVSGVPEESKTIISLLLEARKGQSKESNGPIVIHCSPGTGRTGAVLAVDICLKQLDSSRTVDIPRCVYRLRQDRSGCVQTKEQYAFIYKAVNYYASQISNAALDSL